MAKTKAKPHKTSKVDKEHALSVSNGERSATSQTVREKPARLMTIQVRDVDTFESIACGFRASCIRAEVNGEELGSVDSGGGFGGPWIHVTWGAKRIAIHAVDLLRAFVAEVAPADLKHFDE